MRLSAGSPGAVDRGQGKSDGPGRRVWDQENSGINLKALNETWGVQEVRPEEEQIREERTPWRPEQGSS